MVTVFVIAFIACAQDRCHVSYPAVNRYFPSYHDCMNNLSGIPGYRSSFDPAKMAGTEITCLERSIAPEPWRAMETTSLRSGPAQTTRIIGTVHKGHSFFVIGRDGKWLQILTDDARIGYFFGPRARKEQ